MEARRSCFSTIAVGTILLLWLNTAQVAAQFWPGGMPPETIQIGVLQSDPNAAARREAARWLGVRGSVAAITALTQAAAFDPDRQVRNAAGDAIALIRRRSVGNWLQRPPQGGGNLRALVESWYLLYLRRPADPTGLTDKVNRLRRGTGHLEVQAAILGSEEYFRLHGSRPRAWVAGLYADVLDRSPSPREVQNWIQSLSRNRGSRERTAAQFLNAAQAELGQSRRPR
jgi:hypothetical protein